MKIRTFLVTILLFIASCFIARPMFNMDIQWRVLEFGFDNPKSKWDGIQIEKTFKDVDAQTFYSDFERLAEKNHLVFYKVNYIQNEGGGWTNDIYCSYNEDRYHDWVLTHGQPFSIGPTTNPVYSSYNEDPNFRIANLFDKDQTIIQRLINDIQVGGYFNYKSLEGDVHENIEQFVVDLQSIYGEFDYVITNTMSAVFEYYPAEYFSYKTIKVLFSLLLGIFLSIGTFSLSRRIALMKLDGYSNIGIYFALIGKYFIGSFVICLLITIVVSGLYFRNPQTIALFLWYFSSQLIQFALLTVATSLSTLLVIECIPIASSEKGSSKTNIVVTGAYIFKFVIAILMIPVALNNLVNIYDVALLIFNYPRAMRVTENMYYFGTQVNSNWFDDIGTPQINALYDRLVQDANMMEYSAAYIDLQTADRSKPLEVFSVGYEYLYQYELVDESFDLHDFAIFYNEQNQDDIPGAIEKLKNVYGIDDASIHLIQHEETLPCFSIWGLFHYQDIRDYLTIYTPVEDRFSGQVNGNLFYYDGSRQQAQHYMDSMFEEYGYSPTFQIGSVHASLTTYLISHIDVFLSGIISLLIMVVTYILNNVLLYKADHYTNMKRYKICAIEQTFVYDFGRYCIQFVLPLWLATVFLILAHRIIVNGLTIGFVGCLTGIEILIYILIYGRLMDDY